MPMSGYKLTVCDSSVSPHFKVCRAPDNKIGRKNLISRVKLNFFAKKEVDFKFFCEHFETAGRAIVVSGAVVRNH